MEKYMYSIFDKVSGEFCAPFLANNDNCAVRTFKSMIGDKLLAHSPDFEVYKIGSINLLDGKISNIQKTVVLGGENG